MGLHEIEQSIIAHSRHIPSSSSCELVFSQADLFPLSVVEWQVDGSQSSRLILDRTLQSSDRLPFFARRLACVILLLEMSHSTGKLRNGSILINLNDNATGEGIAFCSNNQSNLLIPDPEFISRRGYQDERDHWSDTSIPWMERLPVVFWRGSTSGRRPEGDWRRLPRLQLCRKAKSNPDLFDAGIARVAQLCPEAEQEISSEGLVRAFIPSRHLNYYRYHVDIDGNTSAWASLFLKLLSGSPVLKVSSPENFRQWYYPRLRRWEHFVPVEASLEDLVEKAEWLRKHDDKAERIGQAGRSLATAMTYETETLNAALSMAEALGYRRTADLNRSTRTREIMHKIHGKDIYADFSTTAPVDSQGWNSSHPIFAEVVKRERPTVLIDVGVWKGGSTLFLGKLLRDEAIDGTIIAVDTFLGSVEHWIRESPLFAIMPRRHGFPALYEQFLTNLMAYDLQSYVVPLPQISLPAARLLTHLGIRADLVHIDASHEHEDVLNDVRAYWQILHPGGYLIGDDYGPSWPGVVTAADEFSREAEVTLTVHPPKWVIRKPG